MIDRHAVAQYARNQFGVVPILRIEFLGKPFNSGFVSSFVLKLEVVAFFAIRASLLYDASFCDSFWQCYSLFVVL